jgi:hypothetical protein
MFRQKSKQGHIAPVAADINLELMIREKVHQIQEVRMKGGFPSQNIDGWDSRLADNRQKPFKLRNGNILDRGNVSVETEITPLIAGQCGIELKIRRSVGEDHLGIEIFPWGSGPYPAKGSTFPG